MMDLCQELERLERLVDLYSEQLRDYQPSSDSENLYPALVQARRQAQRDLELFEAKLQRLGQASMSDTVINPIELERYLC